MALLNKSRLLTTASVLGAVSFFLLSQACGGDSKLAKVPASATDGGSNAAVENEANQQVGVAESPDERSDLTGEAKSIYDRAFQAWMAGDLGGAKRGFAEAAQKAPQSASPHYSLGTVLERLGDIAGAQQEYRQSFSLQPKYELGMGALAISLARTGHAGEAETFIADKRQKNPDSVRLMTYLAEVKSLNGDSTGAQQLAQEALKKQPTSKEAMLVVVRDYYRQRKYEVALYALRAILQGSDDGSIPARDKGNPEAHLLRGLIQREQGQRRQALEDFEAAIARRPDLFEAYVNLGEMRLEAGNAQEALGPLEKAVKYSPGSAIAHSNLGDCYRLLGRAADAKREFDMALSLDSSIAGIHYNLGLLYLFSPSVPGASSADDQVTIAIREFETFKSMRGAKARGTGAGDDIDELLSTAKRKQGELQVKKNTPPPAATPAPAPAGSGAPKAGTPPGAAPGAAGAPVPATPPAGGAPAPAPAKK